MTQTWLSQCHFSKNGKLTNNVRYLSAFHLGESYHGRGAVKGSIAGQWSGRIGGVSKLVSTATKMS